MWLLDVAIVDRRGARASRLRTLWRSLVCFAVCVSLAWINRYSYPEDQFGLARFELLVAMVVTPSILFALAAGWSVWSPERGLHDRLAGTRLVRG